MSTDKLTRDTFFQYIYTLDVEGVKSILKENPGWANILNRYGDNPLIAVCNPAARGFNSDRQLQIVDLLIENGAKIDEPSDRYIFHNPLKTAVQLNNPRLVRHLLDLGANPNPYNINVLATALDNSSYDIAVLLILYGAEVTEYTFDEIVPKKALPDDLQVLIAKVEPYYEKLLKLFGDDNDDEVEATTLETKLEQIDLDPGLSPLERATERALVLGRKDFLDLFLKWTPSTHPKFKQGFKDTVHSVLLSGYRENSHVHTTDGTQIPPEILFRILSFAGRPGDDESARGRVFSRSTNE